VKEDLLLLVDEQDNPTGSMSKREVHARGLLHRAFSVFIFNAKGDLLLQQRAFDKYHSGGLWSNTCCSHPRAEEDLCASAGKRLFEEMHISCTIQKLFSFIYRAQVGNDLIEYELDHVFAGISDMAPVPDITEAAGWRYIGMNELQEDIRHHPESYTEWLKICLDTYGAELMAFSQQAPAGFIHKK